MGIQRKMVLIELWHFKHVQIELTLSIRAIQFKTILYTSILMNEM